jgi:fibronectin-binding autotransporter adhesin
VKNRILGYFAIFCGLAGIVITVIFSPSWAAAEDFDWRNINGQNWVTSVKNQGGAGTCWDFAACGTIEAKYMLTRDDTTYQPDISEQQSVCAGVGSISGGNAYEVDNYARSNGIVLESELPYTEQNSSPLWPLAAGWGNRAFKPTDVYTTVSQGADLAYVKACLKAYGPLTLHCVVPNDWYNLQDGSGSGNHEVEIVGFHDDQNVPGGGYWIIKNSWGWWWNGDGTYSGYGQISYAARPDYSDPWYNIFGWWDNHDVTAISGSVYFTGPSATVSWTGGSGVWAQGGNTWSGTDMYGNNLPNFVWDNFEPMATFGTTGGRTVTINGAVVGRGVTITSGATDYVFNGTNNAKLTTTAGGLVIHESVTFNNVDLKIGAPQTWTIDTDKSLYIGGSLHTIVNSLTINGDGNITITGNIDGGGTLNSMGWAPGAITKNGAGTLHLTGAAGYGVPLTASGVISFEQDGANCANFYNNISGSAEVQKHNSGMVILGGSNSYTGLTRIFGGAVQANVGAGIPGQSAVVLQGGVLQSNSAVTYTDKFWAEVPDYRCVSIWSGGFAGGGGKMTVNLRGDGSVVLWSGNGDTGIAGDLILSSTTAQYEVEFQNVLDLNGAERTIYVEDNPSSSGDFATISGHIEDYTVGNATGTWTGGINKTGPGRLILNFAAGNDYGDGLGYTGNTTITQGVLQADRNVGLSGWSGLILNGGVLQSNSAITFTDQMWQWAPDSHCVTWNSGGFAGGPGKMTVCIGNNAAQTIAWTGDGHTGIVGTVILSSNSAQSEVEIQNGFDLTGGARTIQVDDNPDSGGDFATLSGVLSDSVGGATLTKTGAGTLYLKGTAANTYTGLTTIAGGTVVLAKTGGAVAIAGNILMSEPGDGNSTFLRLEDDNQIASSSVITFSTPVAYAHFDLNGHSQTLAGISSDPWAAIEGLWDNTGLNTDSTLTINNTADCTFQGVIRNAAAGSGTGRVILVKSGPATLVLTNNDNSFTGGITVNGGTLQIGDGNNYGVLPAAGGAVVNSGGTLYFCRNDGYNYGGAITGSGTVKIYQGVNAVSMGAGYNTSLTGFSGAANILSGAVILRSSNGLGSGSISLGDGANLLLWTSTTTTFTNPITLNGLGGSGSGYAKPAIYGDGGSGVHTLSGQITLATTSDIGNYGGNGMMTISGKITGSGGLVLGKAAPSLADEYGAITISGATSNNYTGGTTINRGTVYLAKSAGITAIPAGTVTIACSTTQPTGQTYLILKGTNQIAPTTVLNFSGVYGSQNPYFELLGYNQTVAGINDTTGAGVIEHAENETNITMNSGLIVNTLSADSYFNGYLRDGNFGAGSTGKLFLYKSGSYKLTLVGPNVSGYTGGTTVNGGTLQFGDGTTNAMLPGNASVASGAMIAFNLAGGGSNITYPGVVSGAGGVKILGTANFTLSGANTYTGTTLAQNSYNQNHSILYLNNPSGAAVQGNVVLDGCYWLMPQAANQFGSNSGVQWLQVAEFDLNGKSQTVASINDTEGHGVIEAQHPWYADPGANSTLTINNASDCYYNGVIYDGGGYTRILAISKTGAGKLTLAGNSLGVNNAWTGGTTISGGTLQIGDGTTNAVLPGNVANNATLIFNVANGTSAACNAVISGTGVVNSVGAGVLTLGGTSANSYSGGTTVSGGRLVLAKSNNVVAIPGNVTISTASGVNSYVVLNANNQIATSAAMTFSPSSSNYACFELFGKSQQLASISDTTGRGVIENTETETGVSASGTLVISNTADCSYNGFIRNYASGTTGSLKLIKAGAGRLTLSGANCGGYTGGLTVNAGTLDYSGGVLPSCPYVINGGTLDIGSLSKAITYFILNNGTVAGNGTLTNNTTTYDIRGGTVNAVLAGSVGLNKTTASTATINAPTYTGTTNVSAGTLNLTGALPGGNYVISGGTLDIGGLSKSIGNLQITGGTVNGAGALASSTTYDVQGGTVNAILAGGAIGLNKTGSATAILTGANTYGGRTILSGGTLELGLSAQNTVLGLGGADIRSGRMMFDYAGGSDPAATILGLLTASCDGGLWDVGQFRNSTASSSGLTLGWFDNPAAQTVTVMATYAGDFNLDGVADAMDMNTLISHLGRSGNWSAGDADYDGLVDLRDWNLWKSNFGLPALGGSAGDPGLVSSPEPGTLSLLAAGLLGLLVCVWRRRG